MAGGKEDLQYQVLAVVVFAVVECASTRVYYVVYVDWGIFSGLSSYCFCLVGSSLEGTRFSVSTEFDSPLHTAT